MSFSANTVKRISKQFIPPAISRARHALFGWRWFRGRYDNWAAAENASAGYDQPLILEKVLRATLEVKADRACYERDSVLFFEPAPDAHLLSCLCQVAAANGGRLRVLDFGGSLGTTYWQHRAELRAFTDLRWDVVEQGHFVKSGRESLQNEVLRFYHTIDEADADTVHDVLLVSGVVHCLSEPHGYLNDWVRRAPPFILFHNLPLHDIEEDYVRVEHVPPEIYSATYPVWFLNRDRFLKHFTADFDVLRRYASPAVWSMGWKSYASTGLFLRRKTIRRSI